MLNHHVWNCKVYFVIISRNAEWVIHVIALDYFELDWKMNVKSSPLLNQSKKNVLYFFHDKNREKIGMIYKFSGENEIHSFERKSMNLSKNVLRSNQSLLEKKMETLGEIVLEIETLERNLETSKELKKRLQNQTEILNQKIDFSNL
jgi:hypothetical protein